MTDYESTMELADVADLLRRCEGEIVVLTHAKPDGDALGCVLAMTAGLRSLGKTVSACVVPPVPQSLLELPGAAGVGVLGKDQPHGGVPADPAVVVVLDTGAKSQLGPLADYVEKHLDRTLIIDHHLSGDVAAPYRYIDAEAAAAAEPVAELLDLLMPEPLTDPMAELIPTALYAAIASDTGWFRFSNTSPRTLRLAARLLEAGVDHADLYRRLEQSERPAKVRLLTRALDSLELLSDARAALLVLRGADFAETGAQESETERIIDVPQMIGSVQIVALVTERQGGAITAVSFRSKPGMSGINVAEVAGRFGGGGHARAAGAKIQESLEEALPQVRSALMQAVEAAEAEG